MPPGKHLSILGSTGSIGCQTLDVARSHPEDFTVVALAAGGNNLARLAEQVAEFKPQMVCVPDPACRTELSRLLDGSGSKSEIVCGADGLDEVASHQQANLIVSGVVGAMGVRPTAAAVRAGKTIALANKETLVAAGCAIMPMVKASGASIVPVDSEHSAIHQSLAGYAIKDIKRILLTGSGGPFRTWTKDAIQRATAADALKHPNWSMGQKITIDSATLMNKGLEIIEARWLFDLPAERIDVVIHPQSILHSAVEYVDGSVVGQLGVPDMHLPIHYALYYPERKPSRAVPLLDLIKTATLTFEEPDFDRFPCLALAKEIASREDTTPAVLNAANEIIVYAFLDGLCQFGEIAGLITKVVELHAPISKPDLGDILDADLWARKAANQLLGATVR